MAKPTRKALVEAMEAATSYSEWAKAARAHDKLTGKDKWRREEASHLYDYASIRRRLNKLRRLRANNDHEGLLFTLNEGIHGNMAGIGSRKLYRQSLFGTKTLITEYIDEVAEALEHLARLRSRRISFEDRLEFFRRADHCFGRSALMLSGGAALGHFHVGVVKALVEEGILPSVISGSSAGSVIAAVVGTHADEKLVRFFDAAALVNEARVEASWLSRMLSPIDPQFSADDIQELVDRLVPDLTFQQAYELTGRQINISVAPAEKHQASRLLNAITSPNVYIRTAVMASCAIPGLFPPVMLEAQSSDGDRAPYLPSRRWVDGSVAEDMPAKRLARLYGVNHYIASQINPIVLWFIQDPKARQGLLSTALNGMIRTYQEWLRATQPLTQKLARRVPRLEVYYNLFYSVATQNYTGDINILPRSRVFNPMRLLTNLSENELLELITEGERATWPRIEMIRNCSTISRTLDKILRDYERRALRYSHRRQAADQVA